MAVVGALVLLGLAAIMLLRERNVHPVARAFQAETDAPSQTRTHQISGRHWIVSSRQRDEYLSDLAQVATHILLTPTPGTSPESVELLAITRLSEDNPIYAAGLRKGDEILTVNGTPIQTMSRAMGLVHEVKRSDDLTVQVRRGDELIDYRFEFR